MTSFIDLMANDVWSDADISNRCRALIESRVSAARQDELRTIMLGHIAGMRTATPEEMAEIMLVKSLTESAADLGRAARADMALLTAVMAHERAALEALVAHDTAIAMVADLPEDAGPVMVPDLLPDPVEGDVIYAVWRARRPEAPTP